MRTREELHTKLCQILGNNNVYFQPPETIKMQYPCIIYSYKGDDNLFANDRIYNRVREIQIQHISRRMTDSIVDDLTTQLNYCRFTTSFVSDNLLHENFTLYL